jgi:hypothetical protein
MSRTIVFHRGKEHFGECSLWNQYCENGNVSYEWYACDCSMAERRYQIRMNNQTWVDITNCPFCGTPINSTLHEIMYSGKIA